MAPFPFFAVRPLPAYHGVCGGSPGRLKGVASEAVVALAAIPLCDQRTVLCGRPSGCVPPLGAAVALAPRRVASCEGGGWLRAR